MRGVSSVVSLLLQFYSSLFLVEIKDPFGLLYSHPFCSRPKRNVDTPWSCLPMAGSVFPYLPCITSSVFNLSPSFPPHPPQWSLMAMLLMVCTVLERSCFSKEKGCKLLKQSRKVANQILRCIQDENARSGKQLSHVLHFKFLKQNWSKWAPTEPTLSPFFQQRRKGISERGDSRGLGPKRLMAKSKCFSCF